MEVCMQGQVKGHHQDVKVDHNQRCGGQLHFSGHIDKWCQKKLQPLYF